ncbi:YbaN family protein [uncultured Neptuniibacter sp.]|uniref:YbaN family protein n=1 Tax=uncultured Neptuniibacter sp. TaxID=502143 RepID=UPI002612C80C|nr:YbaN family protein [uncultured Neptuniibacter sp.]
MRKTVVRTLYLISGMFCVVLGAIGVILPLLPTTPFLLVAAFCFSRSSERLHQALLHNRYFGKIIQDWEREGVIPFKAKLLSTIMMLLMVSYPLLYKSFHLGLKLLVVATIIFAMVYVWSRPSQVTLKTPESSRS